MITNPIQYSKMVFWLKLTLGLSAGFLFLVIFVFSYSKKVESSFKVITKDVRIGLKYQARDAHIIGNTSDGGTFDFHAKALNPSHQNEKTVILSNPLGKISFSICELTWPESSASEREASTLTSFLPSI